ncbi:DUF4113 domain-containing protein [Ktedonobacter robiniae]|uniref:DUF4113 domain-containing protein n=1 Tax=Ktedonobacter robiniae TaxID=2778365 RepID=A0ABQ3V728_9CHLR|nr:DUF4113 domain-containing protein [Ktedonobacter robiniae]GHO60799.1 hypothetical protein KSB_92740 [Ktedonobacter robiniae]
MREGEKNEGGEGYARQERVMDLVDAINEQWDRRTLRFGSQGTQRTWFMR